jgi:hypothetical protein
VRRPANREARELGGAAVDIVGEEKMDMDVDYRGMAVITEEKDKGMTDRAG